MTRSPLSYFTIGLALLITCSLIGCGSETGGSTTSGGQKEEPEPVAQSFRENCSLCHSAGSIADVAVAHSLDSNSPQVSILAVREITVGAGDIRLEIDFEIVDSTNPLIPIFIDETDSSDYRNVRFTLVKLVMSPGGSGDWQSYISRSRGGPVSDVLQATYERANAGGGVFSALTTPGQYRYRFSFDMNTVTDPVSGIAIPYDRTMTHRIAIQFVDNVDNAFVDFVPSDLPALGTGPTRNIVVNNSCNDCHIKLGLHGGDRINVNYCVTCHNPGSTDDETGNTVDFKVMIHKIHRGENLPEVQAGGEYNVAGHDYSTVVFPQDIRNCTKCHRDADDSDNWMDFPNLASCTSCHDDPEYPGFPMLTAQQIMNAHTIADQVAAQSIQFNILDISTAVGASGARDVTIEFSITDPTLENMPYDIMDTGQIDFTGLSFLIGWNTEDYTNRDSGATPAQALRVSVSDATDMGNYVYSVTATAAIPGDVTGSGVVALQGHPDTDLDGDGDLDDRIPATSVFKSFAITDAVAQDRRSIVDTDNCNQCHGLLSLHGGNRNNEVQVCVICHNADATDINRRPVDPTATTDGKGEEAIDFKRMIHAIHAGAADEHGFRENGVVVYGFGGSEHDYSHVRLPAELDNLMNCEGCHNSGTFEVPLDENALPTTVSTGDDLTDPDDDSNITPTASVCSSCHDPLGAKTHMASEGALFDFRPFAPVVDEGDDQVELCGPGPIAAQPAGHVDRMDCCSCHSPR